MNRFIMSILSIALCSSVYARNIMTSEWFDVPDEVNSLTFKSWFYNDYLSGMFDSDLKLSDIQTSLNNSSYPISASVIKTALDTKADIRNVSSYSAGESTYSTSSSFIRPGNTITVETTDSNTSCSEPTIINIDYQLRNDRYIDLYVIFRNSDPNLTVNLTFSSFNQDRKLSIPEINTVTATVTSLLVAHVAYYEYDGNRYFYVIKEVEQ